MKKKLKAPKNVKKVIEISLEDLKEVVGGGGFSFDLTDAARNRPTGKNAD